MSPTQRPKADLEELKRTLDETEWSLLKPHSNRDAVILVDPRLELLNVGVALAEDSAAQVQGWIASKLIGKPSLEQIQKWDESPKQRFLCLIVQPYVLIQELPSPESLQ